MMSGMSERGEYPAGVPCWVEGLGPRPVQDFYAGVLGWTVDDGVARLGGRAVAGLRRDELAAWATFVKVESAAEAVTRAGGALLGPAGGVAVLQDAGGAVIGVRESGGAERDNVRGAWTMSSLHTRDPGGAIAWYARVFGWEAEALGPLTVFRLAGYAGEGSAMLPPDAVAVMAPPDPNVPTHWSVGFQVADADAAAASAAALGGSVLMGPLDVPGFRSAVLLDPNGAAFTVNAVTAAE
jgi:predicted enzyme related to lactoylglutathione lyase